MRLPARSLCLIWKSGENHTCAACRFVGGKRVAEGFNNGFGAKIAAADADCHYIFAVVAEGGGGLFNVGYKRFRCCTGEMHPSEEIVAGTCAFFEFLKSVGSCAVESVNLRLGDKFCHMLDV